MNIRDRAQQLKTDIPAVFLALKAKETPIPAKVFAGMALVYALSPVDLIPDFIPVLGYLDDLIILPALITLTIRFIPKETFDRYRAEAQGLWQDGKPKRWYYAIPFVLIWLLVLWTVIRLIIKWRK